MPESSDPRPSAESETPRRTERPKQPLYLRLYFHRHLTELVRLVGYDGLPVEDTRERLKPLIETYGKETMLAACEEILDIDETRTPHHANLTAHVRKLAFGILGRPPEARLQPSTSSAAAATTAPPVSAATETPVEQSCESNSHTRRETPKAKKRPAEIGPAVRPGVSSKNSKKPPKKASPKKQPPRKKRG